tara:strand:- start:424 stop:894 length:471 start_codon:yes stop_codon:yes gene_type:complete
MERNIKNLGTAENILILCSRFWLKAHVFRCNTPLILIDHTFKAAKLDNSVRYFHTLMMGLSHLNKTNLRSDFMTSPLTSKNESLLIEIIAFAQKDMKEDIYSIFGPYFPEADAEHFVNAGFNLGKKFMNSDLIIHEKYKDNIYSFYGSREQLNVIN